MCPHGYHHSGSMVIYIYITIYVVYSSQGVKLQVNAQAEPLQNQVVGGGLHIYIYIFVQCAAGSCHFAKKLLSGR